MRDPRPGRRGRYCLIWLTLALAAALPASAEKPFAVAAALERDETGLFLSVRFDVQPRHFLYADQISVRALSGGSLTPLTVPSPVRTFDKFSGEEKELYDHGFTARYRVLEFRGALSVEITYQGCSEEVCFFPETRTFTLRAGAHDEAEAGAAVAEVPAARVDWKRAASEFQVAAAASGYMKAGEFLSFLKAAEESRGSLAEATERHAGRGPGAVVLLVLLGGLALNLTPCVLPMIPINLAILGAGARAASKGKGFLLGATYGLGIALAYGGLGVGTVLTGSRFGAIHASPWFNWAVAGVFVVMAMALFGVFHIDLSRLQNRWGWKPTAGKGKFVVAFVMGILAALLAGACVAPVVISVLVWAANLYARGNTVGLALPFLLGVGMGLPWPFAGAGLSFLPRPGSWMVWVERAFGVFVLGLAFYYGHVGYRQMGLTRLPSQGAVESAMVGVEENRKLAAGLAGAREAGRPVLLDFWATWCKNCLAMEKTTFKSPQVRDALQRYVVVKYAAEKPADPATREVLDYFGVLGLPTYVVLEPTAHQR